MKKVLELSPLIVVAVIIAIMIGLFAGGAFDTPKETTITSSTLTEVIKTAKLTTAKYIQHGIAKAHVEGKKDGYILYYAVVKPNIDFEDISYDINEESKTVSVVLPAEFTFDVELLRDENHKCYYYPEEAKWTVKEVDYICETDARRRAQENTELNKTARESLINTMEALLSPILEKNEYTLVIDSNAEEGV